MGKHYKTRFFGSLKRKWQSFLRENKLEINQTQLKAAAIVRSALRNSESELLLAPVNQKRIIRLDTHGLYIVLDGSVIDITNHKFAYHVQMHHKLNTKLVQMFDNKLDSLIQTQEHERTQHIIEGLDNVLKSIL